jgi:ssDNA-binding replication factor A large subunit
MAKTNKPAEQEDEEFWDDSELEDDDFEEPEEIDVSKLKFFKIKELQKGMESVNVEAKIDFVGETLGKEYGEEPFSIGFIKDNTGEIKITFWGDDLKKARKGVKVRVIGGSVGEYRDQLQLYPDRRRGIDFL